MVDAPTVGGLRKRIGKGREGRLRGRPQTAIRAIPRAPRATRRPAKRLSTEAEHPASMANCVEPAATLRFLESSQPRQARPALRLAQNEGTCVRPLASTPTEIEGRELRTWWRTPIRCKRSA